MDDMDAVEIATLRGWTELTRDAEQNARATAEKRDIAIRKALEDGARIRDVMEITGLSRARIFQVRNNTR